MFNAESFQKILIQLHRKTKCRPCLARSALLARTCRSFGCINDSLYHNLVADALTLSAVPSSHPSHFYERAIENFPFATSRGACLTLKELEGQIDAMREEAVCGFEYGGIGLSL